MCEEGKGTTTWPMGPNTTLGLGGCAQLREMLPLKGFVYGHVKVRVLQPFGMYATCAYSRVKNGYVCSCGVLPIPYRPIPCWGNHMGRAPAHGSNVTIGGAPYDEWHNMVTEKMQNASWYNAPARGQCNSEGVPRGCTWEVLEYKRTTIADCHLDAVIPFFEARDPTCFGGCSDGRYNPCWNSCMFSKVLPGMSGPEIGALWASGFDKCPDVQPHNVSSIAFV